MPQNAHKLTENFSLEELVASNTANTLRIDNTPSQEIIGNLIVLSSGLEEIRALLGKPLRINSGYRCQELNKAVKGSAKSAHMQGYAADFTCNSFGSPLDIVKEILASNIKFDKCIEEGRWVHISFSPELRREILTAHFDANNNTTYTKGVFA